MMFYSAEFPGKFFVFYNLHVRHIPKKLWLIHPLPTFTEDVVHCKRTDRDDDTNDSEFSSKVS